MAASSGEFDAVVILGGGVREGGVLPPWVANRFDRAAHIRASHYICLSGGTAHKPLPMDSDGRPIFESVAGARYLASLGVDPARILYEIASYDTIGNAYFARVIHTDPMGVRRLLILTSEFHMARTEAIFRWVFGLGDQGDERDSVLNASSGYQLTFEATPNAGLDADALAIRREREANSLRTLHELIPRIRSRRELHAWMFSDHGMYAAAKLDGPREAVDARISSTYG